MALAEATKTCPYCDKDIGTQANADHEGDRRCPHCGRQIERAAESEDPMDEPYWLNEAARKFTAEQRKEYADKGWALPDGSFPIPDADALGRAIGSWGRAVAAGKTAQVKRLLLKRAKELKASDETLDRIKGLTEAEDSLEQQSENVRSAWYAEHKAHMEQPVASPESYVQEVYDDHCIIRQGEEFFSVPYTEQDGEIVFDAAAAKKVERSWVVAEADGSTWLARPLAESEGKEPDGSRWEVVIIRSGTSKNRRRYPEKVLKEAAPLFEGARVLARSDEEHIEGRGKSVRNIVGWLSDVVYRSKAIRGVLNVLESEEGLRRALLDAWSRGKRDLVGLSIVAEGKGKAVIERGQRFIDVEAIKAVSSVDLVFDAAAGGGLVKLVAALGEKEAEAMPPLEELTIEELETARPDLVEQLRKGAAPAATSEGGGDPEGEPKPNEPTPPAGDPANPAPAPTGDPGRPTPVAVAAAEAEGDEDEDLIPTQLGRFVIREALEDTTLPEVSRKRIAKQFTGKAFHEAELGSAIKDELEMWKDLEKANLVKSRGDRKDVEVGMTEASRAKAALDGFFTGADVEIDGEKVPRYRSFRQAYEDLTGDHAVSGRLPRTPTGRLGISEANGGRVDISRLVWDPQDEQFTEAIQSTTFAEILGDSVTRQMLREYTETELRIWEPVTDVVPVRDFRTQRRMRFGGYGNLPAVAQNAAYAALTSPADEEATYAASKRGGTETITLEAIANDDVSALRRIPQRLARAGAQTLHEFVLDFMATNAAIYDAVALAAAGHNNIGTTAMSAASLKAAYARMRKQTDMSSAKRLNLIGKLLWVPIDLEDVAFEITQAERKPGTADNDANFVRKIALDYVTVPYWTDTNNWWLTASKDQTPLVEIGFYGPEEPELFAQDMPNVGEMFTNDRIVYKIRHIYGGAVMDFRGFDGSIVA